MDRKLVDKLKVRSDNGEASLIYVYEDVLVDSQFSEIDKILPGTKKLISSLGNDVLVKKIDDITYEISKPTGEVYRVLRQ